MESFFLSSFAQLSWSILALRVLLCFLAYLALHKEGLQFRLTLSTRESALKIMHSSEQQLELEFLFYQYLVDLESMSLSDLMQLG